MPRFTCLLCCVVLVLAACQRHTNPEPAASATPSPAAASPTAPHIELHDVMERDPRYMVGISFPADAQSYPDGLKAALDDYARAARAELMQAVQGLGQEKPPAPYDLALAFTQLARSDRLVVVAADGSSYTGGAHGTPLLARFVWLLDQDRRLAASELVPERSGWADIAAYVREQLQTALSQRLDAGDLAAGERGEARRNAMQMIEAGTAPKPENFGQFEPVLGADGRIRALRFVFAPYQVGPYSDGVQTVEVPASFLLPRIAPQWRSLFVTS